MGLDYNQFKIFGGQVELFIQQLKAKNCSQKLFGQYLAMLTKYRRGG